ncbi:MAG: DNA polymerase/3'-5' exonuclease PolX [bacterium]|nr:DNA polymerase/3'-5' exonuclease PolX [bacterium]
MELGDINERIAEILSAIADFLEMKGENIYRVMAFRKASRTISGLPKRIESKEDVISLPGIGKVIGDMVEEILKSGTASLYEELIREIPEGVREFQQIQGIGPKTAFSIYKATGASSLEELYELVITDRLRDFNELRGKTLEKVYSGIERALEKKRMLRLDQGFAVYLAVKDTLKTNPYVKDVVLVGGLRRGREINNDVDILLLTEDKDKVDSLLETKIEGYRIDIKLTTPETFFYDMFLYTGSKSHTSRLLELLENKKKFNSEEEIYNVLGFQYVPPEIREGLGEIELAKEHRLPNLISPTDLKGDLHIHSLWSDGTANILDMAFSCIKRGYRYMAITDHSGSLKVAGGLSPEEIREQHEELKMIENRLDGFTILKGIEVDILPDGSLDTPEDVLKELDIVIASIHTNFRMEEKEMTERIMRAISNPYVNILAHPTGRILLERDPYKVDMEKILRIAGERGVIMEINSSPERLDLNEVLIREGKRFGVRFAINTDAHSPLHLDNSLYGVITARRGWLEPKDVINTYDLDNLKEILGRRG